MSAGPSDAHAVSTDPFGHGYTHPDASTADRHAYTDAHSKPNAHSDADAHPHLDGTPGPHRR